MVDKQYTKLAAVAAVALGLLTASPAHAERSHRPQGKPSLVTNEPLEAGGGALSVGGGLAIALPMITVEAGAGLGGGFDLIGRYESVLGLLHFPSLGARYALPRMGNVQLGARLTANAYIFGLKADQVNLTSVLYAVPELGLTWFATPDTRAIVALSSEIDLLELRVIEDEDEQEGVLRYDATTLRVGFQTTFTDDMDAYVTTRLRLPTETLEFEATAFFLVPLIEGGVTWTF